MKNEKGETCLFCLLGVDDKWGNSIKGGTRVAEIGVVVTQRESPNNIIPANDEILFCCDCGIEK